MSEDVYKWQHGGAAHSTNAPDKIAFRQKLLSAQEWMLKMRAFVTDEPLDKNYPLTHQFTPVNEKYGCCNYARSIFLPKGSIVIGKIHRHSHLNLIMQGAVSVNSEFGIKRYEAPCIFISEPGTKRVVSVEEDTIWCTVHMTEHRGEEHLAEIEQEVISPTYDELGLLYRELKGEIE